MFPTSNPPPSCGQDSSSALGPGPQGDAVHSTIPTAGEDGELQATSVCREKEAQLAPRAIPSSSS